jgi:hypothetical protein
MRRCSARSFEATGKKLTDATSSSSGFGSVILPHPFVYLPLLRWHHWSLDSLHSSQGSPLLFVCRFVLCPYRVLEGHHLCRGTLTYPRSVYLLRFLSQVATSFGRKVVNVCLNSSFILYWCPLPSFLLNLQRNVRSHRWDRRGSASTSWRSAD